MRKNDNVKIALVYIVFESINIIRIQYMHERFVQSTYWQVH